MTCAYTPVKKFDDLLPTTATIGLLKNVVQVPNVYPDTKFEGQFGFVSVSDDDVFIHPRSRVQFRDGEFVPFKRNLKKYKAGDKILILKTKRTKKGLKAVQWAVLSEVMRQFRESVSEAQENATYRMVKRSGFINYSRLWRPNTARYETLWEGKDVEELKSLYPRKYPNLPHNAEDSGLYFEVQVEGEDWKPCGDPR